MCNKEEECGAMEWIDQAQYMESWVALAEGSKDLSGSIKGGILLK
jgi:hypothetical protein